MSTTIFDKRKYYQPKAAGSRKQFIKRYKEVLKNSMDRNLKDKSFDELSKDEQKIKINKKDIKLPKFGYKRHTGTKPHVWAGNKQYRKGYSKSYPNREGRGSSSGGNSEGTMEDAFHFILTREEFLDLYFGDLRLPNFIKKSETVEEDTVKQRSGYSKSGIMSNLDLKKTMMLATMRKIATGCDEPYLDDVDLRYKYFSNRPKKAYKAHVFCILDVSGSMGNEEKTLAKMWYLFLTLFLERVYTHVEITFIRFTTEAREVSQQEFFYGTESGGTAISTGVALMNDIIKRKVDYNTTNIYGVVATDGDNQYEDFMPALREIDLALSTLQFFVLLIINPGISRAGFPHEAVKRYSMNDKCLIATIQRQEHVMRSFRTAFSKGF